MIKMILLASALAFSSGIMTACSHKAAAAHECCAGGATECPMEKEGHKDGHDCQECKHDHDKHAGKHCDKHDGKECDMHEHDDKAGH